MGGRSAEYYRHFELNRKGRNVSEREFRFAELHA